MMNIKNYCELDYAQITASHINSNHHPVEINQNSISIILSKHLICLKNPHGDSAAIPLNILTKQIHKAGIKLYCQVKEVMNIFRL